MSKSSNFRSEKMHSVIRIIKFALLIFPCAVKAQSNVLSIEADISADVNTIYYSGVINVNNVKKVLPLIESGKYSTLRINSRGGEIMSAMDFGAAVFKSELDVVVTDLCNSSCANYIFPAGRKKKIEVGAFVMWHGDTRQRNFLLDQAYLERKALQTPGSLTTFELKRLTYSQASVKKQDAFYKLINIDGQIARLGQEIDTPVALWAFSAENMNVFNIRNVEAPSDYGSKAYCQKWLPKHYANPIATCLELSTEYLNSWRLNRLEIAN